MRVRKLASAGGVEVTDCDLRSPAEGHGFDSVSELFEAESLIVFRDQTMSQDQASALIEQLGPVIHGIGVVTNAEATGRGELLFHSEQSFQRDRPIWGLALYCQETSGDGATLFINCAAAFDALPVALRDQIEGVNTTHSFDPRVRLGSLSDSSGIPEGGWNATHPALFRHPVTGRMILFASPWFTTSIEGLSENRSRALLSDIFEHLSNPAFFYRHAWRPGDFLLWDNIAWIHARESYDESRSRILWKYEFAVPDDVKLPPPHAVKHG